MKKALLKKGIAILLCALMLVTLLPQAARATDDVQAGESEGYVEALDNIENDDSGIIDDVYVDADWTEEASDTQTEVYEETEPYIEETTGGV